MKWVTRERPKIDRIACPWLVARFIDHNTRIFVVAATGTPVRQVAEAIVKDAFHNVSFFGGTTAELPELTAKPKAAH